MKALTGLRQAGLALQQADGRAPVMPLPKIMPDAGNLRPPAHERSEDEQLRQLELNANVKERGVKSPISLRPHPDIADMWIINHGHRRYEAAQAAGHPTIPYFVDPCFDSYDQIGENLHRSDLSVWAIAEFIGRRLREGESKGQIAGRLGKGQNFVTEHLALVDAPACVHQAYVTGVASVRTLYDLRRAYDEFPGTVSAWCDSGQPITRTKLRELVDALHRQMREDELTLENPESATESDSVIASSRDDGGSGTQDCGEAGAEGTSRQALPTDDGGHGGIDRPDRDAGLALSMRPHRDLRHDVKNLISTSAGAGVERPEPDQIVPGPPIRVRYRGREATLAPTQMVVIAIKGRRSSVAVPIHELSFDGAGPDVPESRS